MAESEVYEVEEIIDQQDVDGQLQFYVKWKNFNDEWNTWEPIDNLLDCFDLVLEFQEKRSKDNTLVNTQKSKLARKEALKIVKKAKKLNSTDSLIKKALQKHAAIIVDGTDPEISFVDSDQNLSVDTSFMSDVNTAKSPKSPKSPKSLKSPKSPKVNNAHDEFPKLRTLLEGTSPVKRQEGTSSVKRQEGTSPVKRTPKKPSKLEEFYDLSKVKVVKVSSNTNSSNGTPKKSDNKKPVSSHASIIQTLLTVSNCNYEIKTPNTTVSKESQDTQKKSKTKKEGDHIKVKKSSQKAAGIKALKTTDKILKKKKTGNVLVVKINPMQKKVKMKKDSGNVNSGEHEISINEVKDIISDQHSINKLPIATKEENKQENPTEKKVVKKKQTKTDSPGDKEVKKKVKKKINLEKKEKVTKAKKSVSQPGDKEVKKKIKKKNLENGKKEKENKGLKRKLDQIEIIDTESDDDIEVIQSTSPKPKKVKSDNSPKKSENGSVSKVEISKKLEKELSKKTLQVKVKPMETSSHIKKMRLIDAIKPPTGVAKSVVRPVSPTPVFTTVKPIMSAARPMVSMETLCGDVPGYHYVPAMIPISPSSMSYKMILDSLPIHYHTKKSSKKNEDMMRDDDVERRLSVRQSECAYRYKEIVVKKCNKYTQIWLNTHTKLKNCLNPQVIQEVVSALNSAKYDDSNLVMFSGLGNVFCSGIDLMFLISMDRKMAARKMVDALRDFMKAIITFPKPLIAVVTGSAIGLGMTMLPLCDIVYASDKASFHLPYSQLSQTPEGCASFMLPNTVGMAMANELLIGGRKITAIEACQLGLVSQVFWPTSLMQEVIPRIENMALQSGKALETTKLLIRSHQRTKIELTNESECNLLLERWQTMECQKAIETYLSNENNFCI